MTSDTICSTWTMQAKKVRRSPVLAHIAGAEASPNVKSGTAPAAGCTVSEGVDAFAARAKPWPCVARCCMRLAFADPAVHTSPLVHQVAVDTQLAMQQIECSLASGHCVTPLRRQALTLLPSHGAFGSGARALHVRGARGAQAGAGSMACRLRRTVPADGQD